MKYRFVALTVGALLSAPAAAQAMPTGCYPVKGKITNNLNAPAAFHTLGVAAVVFAGTTKLKCALEGTPAVPTDQTPGSVAFVHTISCDDTINTPVGPIHSKLQFNTQGTVNPATGFFTETSIPVPDSGTGLFQGVKADSSFLNIEGRIFPTGAIDMTFTGQACY
jgi:hypothetical protein